MIARLVSALLVCVAAPAAAASCPTGAGAASGSESAVRFEPDGLRTGMTAEQALGALHGNATIAKISVATYRDGSTWTANGVDAGGRIAIFFATAATGAKLYRVVTTQPLAKRRSDAVLAGWTALYGKPDGVLRDSNGSLIAGWGYRPGAEGAVTDVGPGPKRMLGTIDVPAGTVEISLVDDCFAD